MHSGAWWKALHIASNIKRAQEARHDQFFFQNVENNEIEIFKLFENNSWINLYDSKSLRRLLVLFSTENTFFGKFGPKIKVVSLSWNFVPRLIQKCRIPWWCSLFFFDWKYLFGQIWYKKIKIVSLSWNFALD